MGPSTQSPLARSGGDLTMKIRPLHDRILVKREVQKESKKGGIIIPDTAKEKPQEGKVIAVGNGRVTDDGKRIALDVKAHDRILFGKYSGSEVKLDDEEYLIMKEEDVLAIIE
jgi:chaperonin GroES